MSYGTKTTILRGSKDVLDTTLAFFAKSKNNMSICAALRPQDLGDEWQNVVDLFLDIGKRGVKFKLLTSINDDNIASLKVLVKNIQIRHLESIRSYFGVSENEYLAIPSAKFSQEGPLVYSNEEWFVKPNQLLFDTLWDQGIPAETKIKEIEEGIVSYQTKIIKSQPEVIKLVRSFVSRAAATDSHPYAYGVSDKESTMRAADGYNDLVWKLFQQNPQFKIRHITDIQMENLQNVKKMIEAGYEIAHIEGNRIRLSVSKNEYVETTHSETPGGIPDEILWSNDPQLVGQSTRIFEALWKQAVPADIRINQLEQGIRPAVVEVMRDPLGIRDKLLELIGKATEEILILFPTANAFHREEKIGAIDLLAAALNRRVKVTILAPIDTDIEKTLRTIVSQNKSNSQQRIIDYNSIPIAKTRNTVTILVVDRRTSFVIEQMDDSQLEFTRAVGVATYSTSNSTVLATIRSFEMLLEEIELLEREKAALKREQRIRITAELLQDILSHDINNYNQIVVTNAELLDANVAEPEKQSLIKSILKASDGSTDLIVRAKKLGKILSQVDVVLAPVDLEATIQSSIDLITKANPKKTIRASSSVKQGAKVLADDLLQEVFDNILSNSVNHSEENEIPIEIQVEDIIDQKPKPCWKITFSDYGPGIPDEMKKNLFTRYMATASGSGLGLSIVHALVVDRYSGYVAIKDRVNGNYTKGTIFEVWLPKAP